MINRWWPAVLSTGLALLGLAWVLRWWKFEDWRWFTLGSVGLFVVGVALFMFTLRWSAYVQLFNDHLRIVTPFLRINISFKRIQRTASATMGALFPPNNISGWQRQIIEPLASRTALVIELNGYPISQTVLKFFLSPFFFKDKTPHVVLLVRDWMRFSAELETLRAGGGVVSPRQKPSNQSILSRLPHK
jgi:hypothetical protein